MRAYYRVFSNSVAVALTYRWSLLTGLVTQALQLLITLFVWKSLFAENPVIQHYTFEGMVTYLILTAMMAVIFSSSHFFRLSNLVYKGTLSAFLVRPYSFWGDSFALFLGNKVVEVLVLCFLYAALFIAGLQLTVEVTITAILLLVSNFVLIFVFGSLVGTLAFWLIEMWPIKPLYSSLMALLGGTLFPLDLLPSPVSRIMEYTPFALFGYVNARAMQGALSHRELLTFLTASLIWNAACVTGYRILWSQGLRRYEAVNA